MNKKRLFALTAGGLVVLAAAVAAGLTYFYSKDQPEPPVYAFASDRTGSGDIFGLTRGNEVVNLTSHPAADWEPAWSPDGAALAWTSHRSGNADIWYLPQVDPDTTGTPVNLTSHPAWDYSPSWSSSSQSIVFVSERDGDPEIFVQSLEGNTAIQLTFNDEMDRLPAWSPDGKMIAFATVRDGAERIHLIRPDGTDERVAVAPPLQGTSPAWAPDSRRLAFVGWDENNVPGIYLAGPEPENVEKIFESSGYMGSMHWSVDGQWITFTSWTSGNHELYAIPASGGQAVRISTHDAWDDSLVINPQGQFSVQPPQGVAQAAPARRLPNYPNLVTGVNMADLSKTYLINDMGFDWGKGFVNWGTVETQPGQFRWTDPDNVVDTLTDHNVKVLLRVHGTPAWARPADSMYTHPPTDPADFAEFMTALATRYKGRVGAYEIWNEPNLHYEWGNFTPDPAAYTELLKAAYSAVKAADPDALVISGGLSTTGDGSPTAYGDLAFLQGMYNAGAKGHFDALGSHPYTFGRAPDEVDPYGLSLSRVAEQYQVMSDNGDAATPIWITEMGWALHSSWDLGEHQKTTVTEEQQAQYLTEAYQKIEQDWPFVQAAFLFNLDFSTVAWYPANEPMRWYAILNPNGTPRQAYTALRQTMRNR